MKPILYMSTETEFNSLGIGVLNECVECFVSEERNGIYECSFKYPTKGRLIKEIIPDRWIKCDASYDLKAQRFKIDTITKPMKGYVTVYCVHCSYLSAQMMLVPELSIVDKTAYNALIEWKNGIVDDNPFEIDELTDIELVQSTTLSVKDVENARQALGGVRGSILDVWGGEYKFDNYKIGLFHHRGMDRGVVIRYGKNLTDINQEESISNTYTSVYPFATYTDDDQNENIVTLDYPYYVDSEYAENYEHRRILRVDFSNRFEQGYTPTKEALQTLAEEYIENNKVGIPDVNIKMSYIDLSKTINFADYKFLEEVRLCDTVHVYFEELGINTKAEVISVKWDTVNERMDSVEIGTVKASLSDTISRQQADIKEAKEESNGIKQYVSDAVNRATDIITGVKGGNIVYRPKDHPSEWFIMDTDDVETAQRVWRYNVNGWGYSNSGIDGPYILAATMEGAINADMITTGQLDGKYIKAGTIDVGSLKQQFTGGYNLIHNSSGLNGINGWEKSGAGAAIGNKTQEAKNNTVAKSMIVIDNAEISQIVEVLQGQEYTFCCKAKRNTAYSCYLKIQNDDEELIVFNEQSTSNWDDFEFRFTAKTTSVTITAGSTGESGNDLYLADMILVQGTYKQYWSPAAYEVYSNITRIDGKGIHISGEDDSVETLSDQTGFHILYDEYPDDNVNEKTVALTFNRDLSKLSRTQINKDLTVGKLRVIPVEDGADIVLLD